MKDYYKSAVYHRLHVSKGILYFCTVISGLKKTTTISSFMGKGATDIFK